MGEPVTGPAAKRTSSSDSDRQRSRNCTPRPPSVVAWRVAGRSFHASEGAADCVRLCHEATEACRCGFGGKITTYSQGFLSFLSSLREARGRTAVE